MDKKISLLIFVTELRNVLYAFLNHENSNKKNVAVHDLRVEALLRVET